MYAHHRHASGGSRSNLGSFTFSATYTALFLLLLIPPVNRPTYASQTIGYIPSVEPKPIVVLASPFRRVTRYRRGAAS